MAKKGRIVPALLSRPSLPDYMQDVLVVYTDLVRSGEVEWADLVAWAAEYGLEDVEYVWEVINHAKKAVDKWQSSNPKSSVSVPSQAVPGLK